MRLLMLGGTAFLSREICRVAVERGIDVVAMARGRSGAVAPGVTFVRGDRDEDQALDGLAEDYWDAVVDVSRQPGQVARAAAALDGHCSRYVYVSSISAYAAGSPTPEPSQDALSAAPHTVAAFNEEDTLLVEPLQSTHMTGPEDYGPAKAACEQHVLGSFGPERSVVIRPGLIGGPGDTSGRSAYWPARFARPASADDTVLVPKDLDQPLQLIDVRDVAAFVVLVATSAGVPEGPVDVVGAPSSLGAALDAAERAGLDSHGTAPRHRVSADSRWLLDRTVSPWAGPRSLPLWLGGGHQSEPMMQRRGERAARWGLRDRGLDQLFTDQLSTLSPDYLSGKPPSGLSDAEHQGLLFELSRTGGVA